MSVVDVKVLWESKYRLSEKDTWGTLFELHRDEYNKNEVHKIEDFGQRGEFQREWDAVAIAFIGYTVRHDEEIGYQGIRITEQYPDYHGYTNNCQNFVRRLLDFISPGNSGPKTIENFINDLLAGDPQSETRALPGAYPQTLSSVGVSGRSASATWYSVRSFPLESCLSGKQVVLGLENSSLSFYTASMSSTVRNDPIIQLCTPKFRFEAGEAIRLDTPLPGWITIRIMDIETFRYHEGWDLISFGDEGATKKMKFLLAKKLITCFEVYSYVAQVYGVQVNEIRLWHLGRRMNRTIRPNRCISPSFTTSTHSLVSD
jgi:hypothetical protein